MFPFVQLTRLTFIEHHSRLLSLLTRSSFHGSLSHTPYHHHAVYHTLNFNNGKAQILCPLKVKTGCLVRRSRRRRRRGGGVRNHRACIAKAGLYPIYQSHCLGYHSDQPPLPPLSTWPGGRHVTGLRANQRRGKPCHPSPPQNPECQSPERREFPPPSTVYLRVYRGPTKRNVINSIECD